MDRLYLKKLSDVDLKKTEDDSIEQRELAERRLVALRKTQARKPSWSYYDKYAEEEISIDLLIEMWEAVVEEITSDITAFGLEQEKRRFAIQTKQEFERRAGIQGSTASPRPAEEMPARAIGVNRTIRMF